MPKHRTVHLELGGLAFKGTVFDSIGGRDAVLGFAAGI
jgi:hypothetical protein